MLRLLLLSSCFVPYLSFRMNALPWLSQTKFSSHPFPFSFNSDRNSIILMTMQEKWFSKFKPFVQISKGIIASSFLLIANPTTSFASTSIPQEFANIECSDNIFLFQQPATKRKVVMVGTAHISEESANVVRRVVNTVKPDVVMVELDPKRVGLIGGKDEMDKLGILLPPETEAALTAQQHASINKPKPSIFERAVSAVTTPIASAAKNAAGKALGKGLSGFYESVEKLGFNTGGEFEAAVEEGRKVGAKVLLGDQDVDVTLRRIAESLTKIDVNGLNKLNTDLESLERSVGAPIDEGSLNKEQLSAIVEKLKQKDVVVGVVRAFKEDLPQTYNALIGERDEYLARSVITAPSTKLVGVVGMAHMEGIEHALIEKGNFEEITRVCPATSQ